MSALNFREQQLYDIAKGALPRWLFDDETNPQEIVGGLSKMFNIDWTNLDNIIDQDFIKKAFGIWLDQHAKDLGSRRASGESDATLAARLRAVQDAVTKPALIAIANVILVGAGNSASAVIVEMRKDEAFVSSLAASPTRAFLNRGYRIDKSAANQEIIVILPYGTSAATGAAVAEAMRQNKAAGVNVTVEIRGVP